MKLNFDARTRSLATQIFVETNDMNEWKEIPISALGEPN